MRIFLRLWVALTLVTGIAASGAELPQYFVQNRGQARPGIRYSLEGAGWRATFLDREIRFSSGSSAVTLEFGGREDSTVEAYRPLPGRVNYYIGNDARQWHSNVPTFGELAYREVYPGIDIEYAASAQNLKSQFIVSPGADPSEIQLHYRGATSLQIDAAGDLIVATGAGEIHEKRPIAWQSDSTQVTASFYLSSADTVGFRLGEYNRSLPLTIDPVITYSTFFGGTGFSTVQAIAVGSAGNAYIAGWTETRDLAVPGTPTGPSAGSVDVFVAKLNSSGTGIVYCTYIGGNGDDRAFGIALDSAGNPVITGATHSTNWPIYNPFQGILGGSQNAFVSGLDSTGAINFSTYLGGNGADTGKAIAVDSSGNRYITGSTTSTNFPVRTPYQVTKKGGMDAFVTKLSPAGAIVYSTYFGGTADDLANGIAVDSVGQATITGGSFSTNLPVLNAVQTGNRGGQDAFVTKFSASGTTLVYSTYFGGSSGDISGPEMGNGVALDSLGTAFITGVTSSVDFPLLNPSQGVYGGGTTDAFVAEFSTGGALLASTYLGGNSYDWASSIVVAAGQPRVAGYTYSTDFPLINPTQALFSGQYDGFVSYIAMPGAGLVFSTYLGGTKSDGILAMAADSGNNMYVAGSTQSSDFPVLNAFHSNLAGSLSGFVTKLSECTYSLNTSSVSVPAGGGSGAVGVTPNPAGCAVTAFSGLNWVTVSVAGSTATYSASANPGSQPRSGGFTVAGQSVSISQAGGTCSYTLNPTSVSIPAGGGSGSIAVTPNLAGCAVMATSNVGWASVSVSGNTVQYSVPSTTTSLTQSGTLTISGLAVPISQAGGVCSFLLSQVSLNLPPAGGSGTIVATPNLAACVAAAVSNVAWASVSMAGNTMSYSVPLNNTPQQRSGTLTLGGQSVAIAQATGTVTLALDQTVLQFGISTGNTYTTSPQTVSVNLGGQNGVAWTAKSTQANIVVTAGLGSGSGTFQVAVTTGAGGIVTVSAPGTVNPIQQIKVGITLNVPIPTLPIGFFDTPANNSVVEGAIAVTGWSVDLIEVVKVDIWRDPVPGEPKYLVYIGDAVFVLNARPDVAAGFSTYALNTRGGWGFQVLTNFLANSDGSAGHGNGTFTLHAIAHNKQGNQAEIGKSTITCNNDNGTHPFGQIDTPSQGGIASGTNFINFGWVLTQNPYVIPTDGSTITVNIDGVSYGHPVYNQYRVDIATLFPTLANANGAVGYLFIDTTKLTNGIHSIGWTVLDNASRIAGVGSRLFTVQN